MTDEDAVLNIGTRCDSLQDVNRLLEHMVKLGGSDLFIMGGSEVWVSLYGRKVKISNRKLSEKEAQKIISEIYNPNAPSLLGAGRPIDTDHEFYREETEGVVYKSTRFRFRVNAVGCFRGGRQSLTITLRSIPTDPPHWEKLGIEREIVETSRLLDQGLIVVAGGTGHGKSTLLASILRDRVETPGRHTNLVTIEKPIEFVYDSIDKPDSFVTQLQVGRDVESFGGGVINSLRMAPNVILVGETRDLETTQASLEASMTGHGVLTTVHANNVPATFQRLMYMFPTDMMSQAKLDILQPMKMIIAQRLVPTVEGGRVALREYMVFDQQHKEEMLDAKDLSQAAFRMVHKHGQPMIEDATNKYQEGIISEEEFRRIKANYDDMKENM